MSAISPVSSGTPQEDVQRLAARSCTECGRRKIRCDRKRPCLACTQRGDEDICQTGTNKRIRTDRNSYTTQTAFDALQAKVLELERTLKERTEDGNRLNAPMQDCTDPPYQSSSVGSSNGLASLPVLSLDQPVSAPEPTPDSRWRDEAEALRKSASVETCWDPQNRLGINAAFEPEYRKKSDAVGDMVQSAFLARLLVLFPRRHVALGLLDSFFATPNKSAFDLLDQEEIEEETTALYEDLLCNRRPRVKPAFIALLLAVFSVGLQAADENVPSQRKAMEACGWKPNREATFNTPALESSFLHVRVSGLTGFPAGGVLLTPQFTVRAWHESILKALHLGDFLASPSLTSLQALFIMGLTPYDHIQYARSESLASVGFVMATRLGLHAETAGPHSRLRAKVSQSRRVWWAMVLSDSQRALASSGYNSVSINQVQSSPLADEPYIDSMAKLAILTCRIVHEINHPVRLGDRPALAPGQVTPNTAIHLSEAIEDFCRELPDYYWLSDYDLEFDLDDNRNSCVDSATDTDCSPPLAGVRQSSPTRWELERWTLHYSITTLCVQLLSRVGEIPGSSAACKSLRQSLHRGARSNVRLARKLCAVWPAFFRVRTNSLALISWSLTLALDMNFGQVDEHLEEDFLADLRWASDQLQSLAQGGYEIGRVKWVLDKLILSAERRCGDATRSLQPIGGASGERQSSVAHINAARSLVQSLLASLTTSGLQSGPNSDRDIASWPSHFVGPETMDRPGTVNYAAAEAGRRAEPSASESAGQGARGAKNFDVLRMDPHGISLQRQFEQQGNDVEEARAGADQVAAVDQQAPLTTSATPAGCQDHSVQSTSSPDQPQPWRDSLSTPRSNPLMHPIAASRPSDGTPHLAGDAAVQESPSVCQSDQLPAPGATYDALEQHTSEEDLPQWMTSLLDAVLGGCS